MGVAVVQTTALLPIQAKSKVGGDMKRTLLLQAGAILILIVTSMLMGDMADMFAGDARDRGLDPSFEHYRQTIRDGFGIDIKYFKESLTGGVADGKAVTQYNLDELLTGIKFELEHTSDRFVALEIAMDHLERMPDYYSRLRRLEREFMSDRLTQM
jgi:hypothetical protein